MKFKKYVKKDVRQLLEYQYKEYIKEVKMTKKEKQMLDDWVSNGHSPYDNDYHFCNVYGMPLDFISANRLEVSDGAYMQMQALYIDGDYYFDVSSLEEENIINNNGE